MMRYFVLILLTVVAVVVGIAGLRGHLSRKPPIEIIPDLNRQFKLRPEAADSFFANDHTSQLPPPGTVRAAGPWRPSAARFIPTKTPRPTRA